MMTATTTTATTLLLLSVLLAASPLPMVSATEWISDIGSSSPATSQRALATRAEKFWTTVLKAAESMDLNSYEDTMARALKSIEELPAENVEVKRLLKSSVERLQRTSQSLFLNAIAAGEAAGEKLSEGFLAKRGSEVGINSLGDVFGQAIRRFSATESGAGGTPFEDEAVRDVMERQGEVLPILQRTADISGDVLTDLRKAKNEAFDALKYDLYNKGVPKTPKFAEDVAYKLVDTAAGMRKKFLALTMDQVNAIARDFEGQHQSAAKVLTESDTTATLSAPAETAAKEKEIPAADAAEDFELIPGDINAIAEYPDEAAEKEKKKQKKAASEAATLPGAPEISDPFFATAPVLSV